MHGRPLVGRVNLIVEGRPPADKFRSGSTGSLTCETSNEKGVSAYVILHDATLREIAARRPATLAELGEISGLGTKKLEAYGEAVLAVVAEG